MDNTECNEQLYLFQGLNSLRVEARFDGGPITSDGGSVLVREVAERTGIIRKFAECFTDYRDPRFISYTVEELVAQRVYGLVCGYEDLNDHESLREDPIFKVLVGRESFLAGKSTLNRLELTKPEITKYKRIVCHLEKVEQLFLDTFFESKSRENKRKQKEIILDFDATDLPLHGNQEGKFFHGYYENYCYLPLYVFSQDHLLGAKLRRSNIDASLGTEELLEKIVPQLKKKYPKARIIVRGDSGFARESIMAWCESNKVDYVLGLARNDRLIAEIATELEQAEQLFSNRREAVRIFKDFRYQTLNSWSHSRRVIGKAEYLEKGSNPRFVVTSLSRKAAASMELYEQWYCKRGDMENRIKEQLSLFADRMSTATIRANQIRLYCSAVAYLLLTHLRRVALHGTALAHAQIPTIRDRLIKIGARIKQSARRIYISFSSSFPGQRLFRLAYLQLLQT